MRSTRRSFSKLTLFAGIVTSALSNGAHAAKRVVELGPVPRVSIQLPDSTWRDFGADYQSSLVSSLVKGGKVVFYESIQPFSKQSRLESPIFTGTGVPAAKVSFEIDRLSFITGTRGERMFYGFSERMPAQENEYPMKDGAQGANWFDHFFDEKFDSRTGLDLGDGLDINLLFAWLSVKYARYLSELMITLRIDAPDSGISKNQKIQVSGTGYFYDVSGAYNGFSGGIQIARRDAMLTAIQRAVDASTQDLETAFADLRLTARIDAVFEQEGEMRWALGTGYQAQVEPGTRYSVKGTEGELVLLEVISSQPEGSIARLIQGDPRLAQPGALLKEWREGDLMDPRSAAFAALSSSSDPSEKTTSARVQSIRLPEETLPKSSFKPGQVPDVSELQAFLKSLVDTVFLPYRIWRQQQYDQSYHSKADRVLGRKEAESALTWHQAAKRKDWAKQIGLDRVPVLPQPLEGRRTLVAVIDSGIDYNHPVLHERIWKNPTPFQDSGGKWDLHGFDFISGDGRPFDDHFHGTQVSSAVLAVAPDAELMPVKVFNPWGITSSAALSSAFRYALDHGARILLCAWATTRPSQALTQAIQEAEARGALVITAAGDRGEDIGKTPVYPATLARQSEAVLAVAAVTTRDQLWRSSELASSYGPSSVELAAPGQEIDTAEPRAGVSQASSTGMAAALVAGAAAREWQKDPRLSGAEIKKILLEQADRVPGLESAVRGGLRLRLR